MMKKLPIGIDGFKKMRTNNFYYVDKTMFIAELLHNWGESGDAYKILERNNQYTGFCCQKWEKS